MRLTQLEIAKLATERGARDVPRVVASVQLAIRAGDPPDEVFAQLMRNQPQLFGAKPKPAKQATEMPHWEKPKGEPRKKQEETPRRNERRWQ